MPDFMIIVLIVLAVVAAGFAVWGVLRYRYVKSLRDKGWTFITSPDISIAYGLNRPPFGVGFQRSVDDQIVGAAPDGTPFSAFRYRSSEWSTSGYVVAMPLGRSLPPTEITASGPWRVQVDHAWIVLVEAPKDAESLERAIVELAELRGGVLASSGPDVIGPPPPPGLSFHERPWWRYVPRDDSFLDYVSHTRGGRNHQAHDIVHSENAGLPFVRLRHDWETTRTVRDSEGRTRTEVDHHSEVLCEFRAAFPFRPLSVNWGWLGKTQEFELEAFNDRCKVRAPDARFASHVIHQRQMDYLLSLGRPSFTIEADGRILVGDARGWEPTDIDRADQLLRGFFARVPDYVWKELGAWPRPVPELEPGPAPA